MRDFGKWIAIAGIGATAITCIVVVSNVVKSIVPAILKTDVPYILKTE